MLLMPLITFFNSKNLMWKLISGTLLRLPLKMNKKNILKFLKNHSASGAPKSQKQVCDLRKGIR